MNPPARSAPQVAVQPDAAALARAGAGRLRELAERQARRLVVAVSGGRTPEALLREWALILGRGWPAERWPHLFQVDERAVPPDHPRSNYGLLRANLLAPAGYPLELVHRLPGERAEPATAAAYEAELRAACAATPTGGPDVVLLGLGADGHTASLFPGGPELAETARWVTVSRQPESGELRLGLTLACLNRAQTVIFLVAGADKAEVVGRLLGPPESGRPLLPAARVAPVGGEVLWLLDAAAAGTLGPSAAQIEPPVNSIFP